MATGKNTMASHADPIDGRPEQVLKHQALESAIRGLRIAMSMQNSNGRGDFDETLHIARLKEFDKHLKIVNQLWKEVLDADKGFSEKYKNAGIPLSGEAKDRYREAKARTDAILFGRR